MLTFGNPTVKKPTEQSVAQKALLAHSTSKELFDVSLPNMRHLRKVRGKRIETETVQGAL